MSLFFVRDGCVPVSWPSLGLWPVMDIWNSWGAFLERLNAGCRATRSFMIQETRFRGEPIEVETSVENVSPFCELIRFARASRHPNIAERIKDDPRLVIVPPYSGHYATLFTGTVEAMLPSHNVTIVNWLDAKTVPLTQGFLDLEDQVALLADVFAKEGEGVHVLAIGQGAAPALAATALLSATKDRAAPCTLTLMGAAIDTRAEESAFSTIARSRPLSWFRATHGSVVPPFFAGAFRRVCSGSSLLASNPLLPAEASVVDETRRYQHLTRGDDDTPEAHRRLYKEFLAVMDVPEELYLQVVERIYQRHDLALNAFMVHGRRIDLSAIKGTAILAIEGERDDVTPAGQTRAALALCQKVPDEKKKAHLEIGVGHYGLFTGRKWRNNIQPVIHRFIRAHGLV